MEFENKGKWLNQIQESSQMNEAGDIVEEYWLEYFEPTKRRMTIRKDGDGFKGDIDYLHFTKKCKTAEECMKELDNYIKKQAYMKNPTIKKI